MRQCSCATPAARLLFAAVALAAAVCGRASSYTELTYTVVSLLAGL